MDTARMTNTSSNSINVFLIRIAKILPPNWQTCFCYPVCLAPFVDTLPWTIPGNSTIDICPGFFSDAITPGFAIEWVRIYEVGFENLADTLVFTANTGVLGISQQQRSSVDIYPNPCTDFLQIDFRNYDVRLLNIYDYTGTLILTYNYLSRDIFMLNTYEFCEGVYILHLVFLDGTSDIRKIIKLNR